MPMGESVAVAVAARGRAKVDSLALESDRGDERPNSPRLGLGDRRPFDGLGVERLARDVRFGETFGATSRVVRPGARALIGLESDTADGDRAA